MPTYSYHCQNCEKDMETFQKITADPLKTCPSCGKDALQRVPQGGIGLSFKGSGFYITDYCCNTSDTPSKEPASSKTGCCPCSTTQES